MKSRVVLGSRGSDLARAQAVQTETALRRAWPDLEVITTIIVTRGDENAGVSVNPTDRRAGRKGLFTREIERALHNGEIDVAVHSAKDLPSDNAEALSVRAALARAAVDDLFIAKHANAFDSLGQTSVVATGSVRRQHQLLATRPGITVVDLRGNVPTRLRKLIGSDWTGIILARAGLERLGIQSQEGEFTFEKVQLFSERLSHDHFLPAGGQGIIALQVRAADQATIDLVDAVNDTETLLCLRAEREFLRLLDGDCDSPVGALATIATGNMQVRAQVFLPGQSRARSGEVQGALSENSPEVLAAKLMEKIHGG